MASISESLIAGLMQPGFDLQSFSQPLGMLLGGAQAQKAREERQKGLLSQAMGATDMNAFQRLVQQQARTPEEMQQAMAAFNAAQQQRATEREQKRKLATELEQESELINARIAAQDIARKNGDYDRARALGSAPMESVQKYIESQSTDKDPIPVTGGYLEWDPKTKTRRFVDTREKTVDSLGYNPDAKSSGQQQYTTPDGNLVSYTAFNDGTILFGDKRVYPEAVGLIQVEERGERPVKIETLQDEAAKGSSDAFNAAKKAREALKALKEAGPLRGGIFGKTVDSVLGSAGLQDEVSKAYIDADLIRKSEALKYLPPGPASNKDVEFVLNASVDPRKLKDEEKVRWLNGYAILKEQEAQYLKRKADHLDRKSTLQGFNDSEALNAAKMSLKANEELIDNIANEKDSPELGAARKQIDTVLSTDKPLDQKLIELGQIEQMMKKKITENHPARRNLDKLFQAYVNSIDLSLQIPDIETTVKNFNRRYPDYGR